MEALLSLTSKRAGDWFKEELRSLGGLDHLVNTGGYLYTYTQFNSFVKSETRQVGLGVGSWTSNLTNAGSILGEFV